MRSSLVLPEPHITPQLGAHVNEIFGCHLF